jgi:ribosome-associated translation inhibitor RaiA
MVAAIWQTNWENRPMHIQLNTDSNIKGDTDLAKEIEAVVTATLDRLSDRITSVEVYLADENSDQKVGTQAIRCVMEARLTGFSPLAVTHHADSVEQAVSGAADKLERVLQSTLDRLETLQEEPPPIE